jgi:hypothetical protein
VLIEPDSSHFDLEHPDVVQKHVEALLASVEAEPARAT